MIEYPDIKTFKLMDSEYIIVNDHEKDSENNVNSLSKPCFPHYGCHGKAYLTFGGKKYFQLPH